MKIMQMRATDIMRNDTICLGNIDFTVCRKEYVADKDGEEAIDFHAREILPSMFLRNRKTCCFTFKPDDKIAFYPTY